MKREKTKVLLSLPPDLVKRVDKRASDQRRARSVEVELLLERSLGRPAPKKAAARGARA